MRRSSGNGRNEGTAGDTARATCVRAVSIRSGTRRYTQSGNRPAVASGGDRRSTTRARSRASRDQDSQGTLPSRRPASQRCHRTDRTRNPQRHRRHGSDIPLGTQTPVHRKHGRKSARSVELRHPGRETGTLHGRRIPGSAWGTTGGRRLSPAANLVMAPARVRHHTIVECT